MIDWTDKKILRRLGRETDDVIAKDLGCSRSNVCMARQRLGIPSLRPEGRPRKNPAREQARALFAQAQGGE